MHLVPVLVLSLALATTALAQQQWTLRQTTTAPPPAIGAAMAYDAFRSRTVLFGGATRYSIPSPTSGDTWLFDGAGWTMPNPANQPPSRAHHSMVGDDYYRRVYLFGGIDGNGSPLNDLWEWDGTYWSHIHQSTGPSPRGWASMANASQYGGVFVYGGYDPYSVTWHGDFWYWSVQSGWSQAGAAPPARAGAAMVLTGNGHLLHGGRDAQRPFIGETWTRSSFTGWQLWPQAGGPARDQPVMSHDKDSGQVFLTGGRGLAGHATDLWRFQGQRWVEITPATQPAPAFAVASALDSARHAFLVFGGATDTGLTTAGNQLWEFQSTFPVVRFGSSCAVTGALPALAVSAPATGTMTQFGVSCAMPFPIAAVAIGFSDQMWGALPLPLDLAFLGLPGCQARVAPELLLVSASAFHVNGTLLTLNIPARPQLAGMRFFVQALVGDGSSLRSVTDAARCTIL